MEQDFFQFLMMILFMFFPFVSIYLILFLLNWNKKKSLLSDSWFAFIAWFVSSIAAWIICLFLKLDSFSDFDSIAGSVTLIFLANVFAITAVLYLKTKAKAEELFVTDNLTNENIGGVGILKIWQTSAIVSFMTLLMITSLFFALQDISQKMEKENLKKEGKNGVSFRIYD